MCFQDTDCLWSTARVESWMLLQMKHKKMGVAPARFPLSRCSGKTAEGYCPIYVESWWALQLAAWLIHCQELARCESDTPGTPNTFVPKCMGGCGRKDLVDRELRMSIPHQAHQKFGSEYISKMCKIWIWMVFHFPYCLYIRCYFTFSVC